MTVHFSDILIWPRMAGWKAFEEDIESEDESRMTDKQRLFEDIKIGDDMLTMENITKIYENGFVANSNVNFKSACHISDIQKHKGI